MKTPRFSFRKALLALAMSSAPALSWAGVIQIEPAQGNVPALLYTDATAYTDAMHGAVLDLRSDLLDVGSRKGLRLLQAKLHGATLGRFEYTYNDVDGVSRTMVYHARSGHSLTSTINLAVRKKGGNSGSESSAGDSSTPESGDDPTGASPEDIAADAREAQYYPLDTKTDKRAVKLPPEESLLDSVDIDDGMNHSWDAELKALRGIEADIKAGTVSGGGKLTGYVSKAVCESCRNAINTFADEFGVDGTVYELIEPSPGEIIKNPSTALERSKASAADFKLTRKAYVRDRFAGKDRSPAARGQWTDDVSIERLEAEEASSLSEGMCGQE